MTNVKEFVTAHKMQLAIAAPAAVTGLSVTAFAETTPVSVSAVTGAMGDLFNGMGTVISQIASQPILLVCLAAGMLSIFIGVFTKMKHAARK